MTRPDKKNKREYERKLKAQGGDSTPKNEKRGQKKNTDATKPSRSEPANQPPSTSSGGPPPPAHLSTVKGEAESAEKLISEASQRFLESEDNVTVPDPKYSKRNITSNWTKYELPSEDSEEESLQNMTGADFNYVLSTAQGADSHFRLKSEQEWIDNAEKLGELSQEFFSLDLVDLEKCIACIPLYDQIGLHQDDLDRLTVERMRKKAADSKISLLSGVITNKTEELKKRMMNILKADAGDESEEEHKCESDMSDLKIDGIEKPLTEILEDAEQAMKTARMAIDGTLLAQLTEPSAPEQNVSDRSVPEQTPLAPRALEQRPNRRRGQAKEHRAINEICCLKGKVEDEELDSKMEVTSEVTKTEGSGTFDDVDIEALAKTDIINEDLEFLDSLDIEIKSLEKKENPVHYEVTEEQTESKGVVQVKIAREVTKNLEDWLDDFLDE